MRQISQLMVCGVGLLVASGCTRVDDPPPAPTAQKAQAQAPVKAGKRQTWEAIKPPWPVTARNTGAEFKMATPRPGTRHQFRTELTLTMVSGTVRRSAIDGYLKTEAGDATRWTVRPESVFAEAMLNGAPTRQARPWVAEPFELKAIDTQWHVAPRPRQEVEAPEKHAPEKHAPEKHAPETPEKHAPETPEKHAPETPEKHAPGTPEKHAPAGAHGHAHKHVPRVPTAHLWAAGIGLPLVDLLIPLPPNDAPGTQRVVERQVPGGPGSVDSKRAHQRIKVTYTVVSRLTIGGRPATRIAAKADAQIEGAHQVIRGDYVVFNDGLVLFGEVEAHRTLSSGLRTENHGRIRLVAAPGHPTFTAESQP